MTDSLKSLFLEYMRLPTFRSVDLTDVNQEGNFSDRPLHVAASRGITDEVEILLQHGAKIDSRGEYMFTPLQLATLRGRSNVVKLLLSRGANPLLANAEGDTALDIAIASQHDKNRPSDWKEIILILQQSTKSALQESSLKQRL